jgi:hypothetical protein
MEWLGRGLEKTTTSLNILSLVMLQMLSGTLLRVLQLLCCTFTSSHNCKACCLENNFTGRNAASNAATRALLNEETLTVPASALLQMRSSREAARPALRRPARTAAAVAVAVAAAAAAAAAMAVAAVAAGPSITAAGLGHSMRRCLSQCPLDAREQEQGRRCKEIVQAGP